MVEIRVRIPALAELLFFALSACGISWLTACQVSETASKGGNRSNLSAPDRDLFASVKNSCFLHDIRVDKCRCPTRRGCGVWCTPLWISASTCGLGVTKIQKPQKNGVKNKNTKKCLSLSEGGEGLGSNPWRPQSFCRFDARMAIDSQSMGRGALDRYIMAILICHQRVRRP